MVRNRRAAVNAQRPSRPATSSASCSPTKRAETRTRFAIGSRESADPPVLIVEGTRVSVARRPCASARASIRRRPSATSMRPGSVILRFGSAGAAHYDSALSPNRRFAPIVLTPPRRCRAGCSTRWPPSPNTLAISNSLGDEVNAVVEGLDPGKMYYFAARAVSATGQTGPVSPARKRACLRACLALARRLRL